MNEKKKKLKISEDTIIGMIGLIICLVSLIIVCSTNTIFNFLSEGILTIFGFIGFWLLIPSLFIFGMYLLFRKKVSKFRLDISIWGIYLIVLALLILSSSWGTIGQTVNIDGNDIILDAVSKSEGVTKYVEFTTATKIFQQISDGNKLITNTHLGGGFIGYVLLGTLNSGLTPIGMNIISWLMILVGICLILHRQIRLGFLYIKNHGKVTKKSKDSYDANEIVSVTPSYIDDVPYNDVPVINEQPKVEEPKDDNNSLSQAQIDALTIRSINSSHGMQKAVFNFGGLHKVDDGQDNSSLSQNNAFSDFNNPFKQYEAPKPVEQPIAPEVTHETPIFDQPVAPQIEASEPAIQPMPQINPLPQASVPTPQPVIAPQPINVAPTPVEQPKAVIKPPFVLPSMDLLEYHENEEDMMKNDASTAERTEQINKIFSDMHIGAEVVGHTIGPTVTRYDVQTNASVSISQIRRVIEDISVRLGGVPVRFEALVLGKSTSGLEVKNQIRTMVGLKECIEALPEGDKYLLDIPFGRNISGELIHASIKEFPHLLVAGATGSGKSIFMHSVILSLLMRNTPEQLKLLLIDPKEVEMKYYSNIPHLLCPNISEPKKALVAMRKLVDEMERRNKLFGSYEVRDIKGFNKICKEKGLQPLPYIVVLIDEYADLSEACKEIRSPVVRIAQKARSAGIHLIIATQRPSVNVIDGVIKANLPSHVALKVGYPQDSITVIGEGGAEKLLGNGDMLLDIPALAAGIKQRVQGTFVDEDEIRAVCEYLRQYPTEFYNDFLDLEDHSDDFAKGGEEITVDTAALKEATEEQLLNQIKSDLASKEYCSISFIQRTYGVGFPKAGRLFARLQKDGYVAMGGDARGSKVLIHKEQSESPTSIDESTLYVDNEANEEPFANDVDQINMPYGTNNDGYNS